MGFFLNKKTAIPLIAAVFMSRSAKQHIYSTFSEATICKSVRHFTSYD